MSKGKMLTQVIAKFNSTLLHVGLRYFMVETEVLSKRRRKESD